MVPKTRHLEAGLYRGGLAQVAPQMERTWVLTEVWKGGEDDGL